MEIIAPFKELNAYVAERFHQPISLSFVSEKEVKVSYTKRVIFKDVGVNINVGVEEVTADSVVLSYNLAPGLDSIISGALSFITGKFPELSAGIHPEDDHRICVNLSEIEKVRQVVENIAFRDIKVSEEGLHILFGLKIPLCEKEDEDGCHAYLPCPTCRIGQISQTGGWLRTLDKQSYYETITA